MVSVWIKMISPQMPNGLVQITEICILTVAFFLSICQLGFAQPPAVGHSPSSPTIHSPNQSDESESVSPAEQLPASDSRSDPPETQATTATSRKESDPPKPKWQFVPQAPDLDDLQPNTLQHSGPWLRTHEGILPVTGISSRRENEPPLADTYDDLEGIEILSIHADSPFSLAIGGRLQARYAYFQDESSFANPTSNQSEIARARLGFRGFAFEEYLRYNIGTDWSPNNARLVNAFAEVDLLESLGIGFGASTRLRYGYWRTNFGRQAAESSQNMQFVDRSLTSNVFNLGNNTGLALLGSFTNWYRPVRYELGLFNGFGTFGASSRDSLDQYPGLALRITKELLGDYASGESDNELSQLAAIRIGGSLAYTRRARRGVGGSTGEFDNQPATLLVSDPSSGNASFAMDNLRGSETEYDLWLAGLEADCKHAGWSLHTEYLLRWIDNVQFTSANAFSDFTHGFYVQGGYFVTEKAELVLRHSSVWAFGRGNGSPIGTDYDTSSNESGGGLNLYFRRHLSKLQMDLLYYDGAPISASSMNLLAGDKGVMFRTQYQIAF